MPVCLNSWWQQIMTSRWQKKSAKYGAWHDTGLRLVMGQISPAGVNQQPTMHQLRMRPLKPFSGWTKNTSPCPKLLIFFNLFSAPKIFPYLPPPPSHLPPPSYLLVYFGFTPSPAQEPLKRESEQSQHKQSQYTWNQCAWTWSSKAPEAGPVSPSFCFVATQRRRWWQQHYCHLLLFVCLQGNTFFFSFSWYNLLCWSKTKIEGNCNIGIVAFFFLFCYNTTKKTMGATLLLPFFCCSAKGNSNVDVVNFYFYFIATKKVMTTTLSSPSSFCFVATLKATAVVAFFFWLQHRRRKQQRRLLFFLGCSVARKVMVTFCFGFITQKKATTMNHSLLLWFYCNKEEEDDNFCHLF